MLSLNKVVMMDDSYWFECIKEAFDEIGITATQEQTKNIAEWVQGAYENYGMAHGHDVIARSYECNKDRRIKELEQELKNEKNKSVCTECNGKGYTVSGGVRYSEHRCRYCNGEGKK